MKDKFRIWNEDIKNYDDDTSITCNQDGYLVCKGFDLDLKRLEKENCTGIEDKNGKLIYENDILECITFGFDTERFVDYIIFKHGRFMWANVNRRLFPFGETDFTKLSDCRIIGNIHQHKHLLEGKCN